MIESYKDLRHRRSLRLPDYDYTAPGAYFVTVCTSMSGNNLGIILAGGQLKINLYGKIVREEWLRAAELRENVELDEFVVMPDHLHGIIILNQAGTVPRAPTLESFSKPTSASLPTIIRYFKAAVTRRIRLTGAKLDHKFWQRGYYEHIIRKTEDINLLREYIIYNPLRRSLSEKP